MMIDRSQCAAPRHGTYTAYRVGCRCPDARESHRLYQKRHRHGRNAPGYIDAIGTRRRLQALVYIGHTMISIGQRLEWPCPGPSVNRVMNQTKLYPRTAREVADLFDQLWDVPGPSNRARSRARREGWRPALAWDDIDNDPEPAHVDANPRDVDEVAVREARAGRLHVDKLNMEEFLLVVDTMTGWRIGVREIATRLRTDEATIERARNTLHMRRFRARRGEGKASA